MAASLRSAYIEPQGAREKLTFMILSRFNWLTRLTSALRAIGPYAALELVLPGGTLIALSVWAFRNRTTITTHIHQI